MVMTRYGAVCVLWVLVGVLASGCDEPAPAEEPTGQPSERLRAEPLPEVGHLIAADLVGHWDPHSGQLSLELLPPTPVDGLRTVDQALYCERRITAGRAETFSVANGTSPVGFTPLDCGMPNTFPYTILGTFCGDVSITSHFDGTLEDVFIEITRVDPSTGHHGYRFPHGTGFDPDLLRVGPGVPTDQLGGLWGYGEYELGETNTVKWIFEYTPEPFSFSGRIKVIIPEIVNGIDDNCDGVVDEGPWADGTACTVPEQCFHGACIDGFCASPPPVTCADAPCDADAMCSDLAEGGVSCACVPGYSGDGFTCAADACAPTEVAHSDHAIAGSVSGVTGDVMMIACDPGFLGGGAWTCDATGHFVGAACELPPLTCADDPCDANASCLDTAGGVDCTCLPGFSGDGTVCIIDQCYATEVQHSDYAASSSVAGAPGASVTVTCDAGYVGGGAWTCAPDGLFSGNLCVPEPVSGGLFWSYRANDGSAREFLARADADGSNREDLYESGPYAVQNFGTWLQIANGSIYWVEKANDGSSEEYIVRTDMDGTNKTTLVTSPAWDVQHFGNNLNVTDSHLYWTSYTNDGSYQGRVFRADLDGGNLTVLLDGLNLPTGDVSYSLDYVITSFLEVTDTHLFQVERAANANDGYELVRYDLDGANRTVLIASGRYEVQNFGYHLEVTDTHLYWAERANDGTGIDRLVRTNIDGTDAVYLVELTPYTVQFFGKWLNVTDSGIYWVEKSNDGSNIDRIVRRDLDGTNESHVVTSGPFAVQDFGNHLQVFDEPASVATSCTPSEVPNSDLAATGSLTGVPGRFASATCDSGYQGGGDWVCNASGEFEGTPCTLITCADAPCGGNATCTDLVGGFDCACDAGYNGDGFTCDGNACAASEVADSDFAGAGSVTGVTGDVVNVTCDAGMVGGGAWTCGTDGTFTGAPCTVRPPTPLGLYWSYRANDGSSRDYLYHTDLSGQNGQDLYETAPWEVQNFGSWLQVANGYVYWVEKSNDGTSTDYIVRTNPDGSDKTTIVTSPPYAVQYFGSNLTVTSTHMYWNARTNDGSNRNRLYRAELDGSNQTVLLDDLNVDTRDIGYSFTYAPTTFLEVTASHIYQVERAALASDGYELVRYDLDGTNRTVLFTSGLYEVQNFGYHLEVTDTHLYWVERANDGSGTDRLVRANADGSGPMYLIESPAYAVQSFGKWLNVTDSGIYWVEKSNDGSNIDRVVRRDLDGTNESYVFTSGSDAVQRFGSYLQVVD